MVNLGSRALAVNLSLMLAVCAASGCSSETLKISHLRSGLVCPEGGLARGSVCFETTKIPITGQGACTYDGERLPCTWYGFEFQYANARPGDEISCLTPSSRKGDIDDPDGVKSKQSARYEYPLKLETTSGRYFNPQYTIFDPKMASAESVHEETVCSFEKRELFKFKFEFQFPS